MNINLKYCKKCKRAYDIGTNYDLCPKCRNKKREVVSEKGVNVNGN